MSQRRWKQGWHLHSVYGGKDPGMLLQAEDRRLAALSAELEATSKELNAGRKRLKADLDVALETSKANDATRSELAARERDVDLHEARLKEWRESTKADVAKQVSDQERKLQVCCNQLSHKCIHSALSRYVYLTVSITRSVPYCQHVTVRFTSYFSGVAGQATGPR